MPRIILPETPGHAQVTATMTWRDTVIGPSNNFSGDEEDRDTWIVRLEQSVLNGYGMLEPNQGVTDLGVGVAPGPFTYREREIVLTHILTMSDEAREQLRRVMTPGSPLTPSQLYFTGWGHPGTRYVWAFPTRMATSITRAMTMHKGYSYDLSWRATDPRIYSTEEVEYNMVVNEGSPETQNTYVVHGGNYNAPWRAELPGPFTAPYISRSDKAAYRWWFPFLTIPSGQSLIIDSRMRTAVVGTTSYWGHALNTNARPAMEWTIPPGTPGVNLLTNVPGAKFWVRDTWI